MHIQHKELIYNYQFRHRINLLYNYILKSSRYFQLLCRVYCNIHASLQVNTLSEINFHTKGGFVWKFHKEMMHSIWYVIWSAKIESIRKNLCIATAVSLNLVHTKLFLLSLRKFQVDPIYQDLEIGFLGEC